MCGVCGVPSGTGCLSLPGSSLRLRSGENDSQREAATQEPPSSASRLDAGHAEVAAALRCPKHTSGTIKPHVTVMIHDEKHQAGVLGHMLELEKNKQTAEWPAWFLLRITYADPGL